MKTTNTGKFVYVNIPQEFLLIRPTKKNLELYEGWIRSPTQSQVFFGDLADTCYRYIVAPATSL